MGCAQSFLVHFPRRRPWNGGDKGHAFRCLYAAQPGLGVGNDDSFLNIIGNNNGMNGFSPLCVCDADDRAFVH